MGLFNLLGKKPADIARELDRSDPMAPSTPMVPESAIGVHQVEKVGGLQWQMRQLREAEQRLDAKAARMGAKARLHVAASIARGEGQFGVDATPHTDDEGRQFTPNMVTDYTTAEADRKLLDLPGGLAPEQARYRKRGNVKAAAPERATEAEVQARVQEMTAPRRVQVRIPGFVLDLARDSDEVVREYLAQAGADLSMPHTLHTHLSPSDCDLTVTFIPDDAK